MKRDLKIHGSYFSGYKLSSFFLVCVFSFSIDPAIVSRKLVLWHYSANNSFIPLVITALLKLA